MPGLYTSLDAGQTWTYNALLDPGSQATDATSATSVAYNTATGLFLAAVRYHGFYSSPDGVTWTRLATQPGGSVLSTSACPPQSHVQQPDLPDLPRRNHGHARTQRNVRLVYLSQFLGPSRRWRHLAEP